MDNYQTFKTVFSPLLRKAFKVSIEGSENIPSSGPVIFASNHLSFSDSIFLPLVVDRRVTFIAKSEYFERKRTAWFFRAMGQIPIKRGSGAAAQGALNAALEVLRDGGIFGIYPEGTRSPDGRLYKGRTGVARMAIDSGAPVIAVAMIGTAEAQPIGQRIPNFGSPIKVRFSKPMSFAARLDKRNDPMFLRQITDEIMFEIADLSGQTYFNEYAPKKKADPAELAEAPVAVVKSEPFQPTSAKLAS